MSRADPPAPRLVREPFRVFFPLAFVLGAAGVSHWIAFAFGKLDRSLGLFHAITMTEAFLPAFAAGFLMTAIPKRTRSAPAGAVTIGALAVLLPLVSIRAFAGAFAFAELAYVAALVVLAAFAVRRFAGRAAGRRPPASFGLVPAGLVAGIAGASLIAWSSFGGSSFAYDLGRRLAFEGVFTLLALGVGAFFLPLATRGEAQPDATSARSFAGYALAGLVVVATYVAEVRGFARAAHLVRGLAIATVFAASGAYRAPTRPGANRRLLWLAAIAFPLGPLCAAALPWHALAAMHVTFIGGFGLLAFAVATHVTLGHGGFDALQAARPWPVVAFGVAFALAALARSTATLAPDLYLTALGVAASAWCTGALVWVLFLVPKLAATPAHDEEPPQLREA
ncbi:MAG TPA: NnrS family protein [Minicystis sp.]|nr:NnrS family protein [Minicystis sp.]